MNRFKREQAHTLNVDELLKMVEDDVTNPTVNRLIFIETRATDNRNRGIFPCWPAQVKTDKDGKRSVILFVTQCLKGSYGIICIEEPEDTVGVKIRFWNLPPSDEVLDAFPMTDSTEVQ